MSAIQTRWVVISGAPCSGKTTVIEELNELGYKTVPETARMLVDQELALGRTIQEIRADESAFQAKLFKMKLEVESKLDPNQLVFLDRALPDSLAYFRRSGLDTSQILADCKRFHYQLVLFFDRLPLVKDYARMENEEAAAWLDQQLAADYQSLGLNFVRVPVMDLPSRLKFVLAALGAPGSKSKLKASL